MSEKFRINPVLLLITAVRVYCCTQKMLKNIETDELTFLV